MRPLSARNPRLKRLGRLARRAGERAEQRALLVEGHSLIADAISHGFVIEELYIAESAVADPDASGISTAASVAGAEVWTVEDHVLERAGDSVTGRGSIGIFRRRDAAVPAVSDPGEDALLLVLADVSDPGNVGTIIRAGVAAGAAAIVVGGGADPTGPKVIRASAGAAFAVPIVVASSASAAVEAVSAARYRTVGTVVEGAPAHDEVDFSGPVAIVLGNEARGLDPAISERLDGAVTIPMVGPIESLNVAMAGTVIAFEVLRQRRAAQSLLGGRSARSAGSCP